MGNDERTCCHPGCDSRKEKLKAKWRTTIGVYAGSDYWCDDHAADFVVDYLNRENKLAMSIVPVQRTP